MPGQTNPTPTFKDLERDGYHAQAATYGDRPGRQTRQAIAPMLEAVAAAPGMRLLDLCCGPGYGAGEAAARGLDAIGVDIAPGMVAEARRGFPGVAFHEGDAEALTFSDGSFDAVICPFGLMHLPEPDKAIKEVASNPALKAAIRARLSLSFSATLMMTPTVRTAG